MIHYNNPTQRVNLVQNKHLYHSKRTLFSRDMAEKIAPMVSNNNHSLKSPYIYESSHIVYNGINLPNGLASSADSFRFRAFITTTVNLSALER